jgi:hypothetical protein
VGFVTFGCLVIGVLVFTVCCSDCNVFLYSLFRYIYSYLLPV